MNLKRKVIFDRKSECLFELRCLIELQLHTTLVLWTLDCSKRFCSIFEEYYPNNQSVTNAIDRGWLWAQGKIKMPEAKKAILAAHNAATESGDIVAELSARAVGHAVATIHTETHALGLVFYGLTALIRKNGVEVIDKEIEWFYNKLLYWQNQAKNDTRTWALFLLKDNDVNKELLLRKKETKFSSDI